MLKEISQIEFRSMANVFRYALVEKYPELVRKYRDQEGKEVESDEFGDEDFDDGKDWSDKTVEGRRNLAESQNMNPEDIWGDGWDDIPE